MENKKEIKKVRWTKRLKATVISLALAMSVALGGAVAALVITSNNNNKLGGSIADIGGGSGSGDNAITTTITASSGLGKFNNGATYRHTGISSNNPVANQSVTVVSTATWGSQTNPYVIRDAADWLFFANAVNNGTATPSGGTAYASATYVINAGGILDFYNTTLTPVGTQSRPFTGTVYGNNTVFYFADIGSVTATNVPMGYSQTAPSVTVRASGLLGITGGNALIADITLDNSCKLASSMQNSSWTASGYPAVGSFVGIVNAGNRLINFTSKMPITFTNTAANNTYCAIGCLVGYLGDGGTGLTVVGCSYVGTMTIKGSSSGNLNDASKIGGLVGYTKHSATYIHNVLVSASYFNTTMNVSNLGLNASGLIGGTGCAGGSTSPGGANAGVKFVVQNSVVEWNCNATNCGSPDYNAIVGYPYAVANGSTMTNVGIISNATNMAGCTSAGWISANRTNVYSYCNYTTAESPNTTSEVRTNIAGNANIKNYLNVATSGVVSGVKIAAVPTLRIHYNVGNLAGANAPVDSSFNSGSNVTLKNPVSVPTGTTFNNWRLNSVTGTAVSNTSGKTTHLTVYAT
ncbi:MAG: hypothetical protein K2L72_04710, partial [Clostridia bacterium]|nr:hypothetical protein [Clostridia bacterium]